MWSNEERARLTQPDLGHGALGLHSLLLDYGDRAAHVVLCFAGKGLVGTPLLGGLNLFVASCISGLFLSVFRGSWTLYCLSSSFGHVTGILLRVVPVSIGV